MSRWTPSRDTSGPWPDSAAGNFVDFVDEEDAHLLDAIDCDASDLVHIDQPVFLFLNEVVEGLGNGHLPFLLLLAEHAGKHVLHVDVHFLDALIRDDFEGGHRALAHFHLDEALIELPFAKLRAKFLASALHLFAAQRFVCGSGVGRDGGRRQKQLEQTLFGGLFGALGHFVELFFADHVDRSFHQIADHRFDVAAHVAHFGVLRSFHFHERAAGQPGQAARDFRLADAGRSDHQDILRENIFGEFGLKLLAADAVAQRDGHRLFRGVLPDDVFVELDDDFARSQLVKRRQRLRLRGLRISRQIDHHVFLRLFAHSSSMLKFAFVKMQISLAMRIASMAISLAPSFVFLARARAAASA